MTPSTPRRGLTIRSAAIPEVNGVPLLEPLKLEGEEGINALFEYRLVLQSPEGGAPLELNTFIGRELTCCLELEGQGSFVPGMPGGAGVNQGAGVREISGLITEARYIGESGRHALVEFTLRPWLHLATLSTDCKVFQDQSPEEIIEAVLGEYLEAGGGKQDGDIRLALQEEMGLRTLVASLWTFDANYTETQRQGLAQLRNMERNRDDPKQFRDKLHAQRYREIYIHSKLMIADDSVFTLGSANLKAMMNLASVYANGMGEGKLRVDRDTERAVLITEEAMQLGIPAAFDFMGTLHWESRGVNGDASRAYAFWQLAADMGSPSAMAYLGKALRGTYDQPQEGKWGNRKVALKMLECGMAQGHGQAAFELGVMTNGDNKSEGEDYGRALEALHSAVKFGSANAADSLSVKFSAGQPIVGNAVDNIRAERYGALGDALARNPDLRFPNLDKVLPLPPAQLPQWDGHPQSLIDAAKGVRLAPQPWRGRAALADPAHPLHPIAEELLVPPPEIE